MVTPRHRRSDKHMVKKVSYIYLICIFPDCFPLPYSPILLLVCYLHSTYPKEPIRTEKPSIFNFGYVKEVWTSGVKRACLFIRDFGVHRKSLEKLLIKYWCISNFFEIGDLRSCLKSRIETVVHVNYDDTELENKGK